MQYTSDTSKKVIQYIQKKYNAVPEFLWAKSNNAVFRHKPSNKWFGALLTVSPDKLGIHGDKNVEILNLKSDPDLISILIDNKNFFPAFHMNKEHWITVLMDGSVSDKNLFKLIGASYTVTSN